MNIHQGSCLCGAVTFKVTGQLGSGEVCHCHQCRQWTGHVLASTSVSRDVLLIEGDENLKWFHSSSKVRRGFCQQCGSSLFFDPTDQVKHNWISIALGAFNSETGVKIEQHIFTAEKGSYYEINDGAKQNAH